MTKIFDAQKECTFTDTKIMFDTNVWIAIDGNDPRSVLKCYSNYYSGVIKNGNTIVVNDYILSEYFNRACKIEYDILFPPKDKRPHFKQARNQTELKERIESIRDTCLNILDECEYVPAVTKYLNMSDLIKETSEGRIDFSDVVIREQCKREGYVLVSHDGDFANCGLQFVTANKKCLMAIQAPKAKA